MDIVKIETITKEEVAKNFSREGNPKLFHDILIQIMDNVFLNVGWDNIEGEDHLRKIVAHELKKIEEYGVDSNPSAAMKASKGGRIYSSGSHFEGYDHGMIADNESLIVSREDTFIRESRENIDQLETKIIEEIKAIAEDTKSGKDGYRMQALVQTLSNIGSGALLGYLKAQGYIE